MNDNHSIIWDEIANNFFARSSQKIEKVLGQGSYGKVYQVFDKNSEKYFAAKFVSKSTFGEKYYWQKLQHPNVLKLIAVPPTNDFEAYDVYFMQYVGPDLFYVLYEKTPRFHDDTRSFMRKKKYSLEVLKGLEYLHRLSFCHLDIKEENILICEKTDSAIICDFSTLSKAVNNASFGLHLKSLPPEVVDENIYDCFAAEMWTYGVFVLQIFSEQYLSRTIKTNEPVLYFTHILPIVLNAPKEAQNDFYTIHQSATLPYDGGNQLFHFISSFLVVEPSCRPTASDALANPFFVNRVLKRKKSTHTTDFFLDDAVLKLENLNIRRTSQSLKETNELTNNYFSKNKNKPNVYVQPPKLHLNLPILGKNKSTLKNTSDVNTFWLTSHSFNQNLPSGYCRKYTAKEIWESKNETFQEEMKRNDTHKNWGNIDKGQMNELMDNDCYSCRNNSQLQSLSPKARTELNVIETKGIYPQTNFPNHHLMTSLTKNSLQFSRQDLTGREGKNNIFYFLGQGKPKVVKKEKKKNSRSIWKSFNLWRKMRKKDFRNVDYNDKESLLNLSDSMSRNSSDNSITPKRFKTNDYEMK